MKCAVVELPDVTIHLVRHGRVENPTGVIYGRLPGFHLSELGRRQAEEAAEYLAGADVTLVVASPLERAQETARAIAARHSLEVETDERLHESHTTLEGVGRSVAAVVRSPVNWWRVRNPLKPSWGESFSDIRTRMLEAIVDAARRGAGREVVLVSHQTPVQVARLALLGRRRPPWLGFVPCSTGSVSSFVVKGSKVVEARYFSPSSAEPSLGGSTVSSSGEEQTGQTGVSDSSM
jgi:broad specificity phosphatase PhoE